MFEQIYIWYVITLPKDKLTQIKAWIIKSHAAAKFPLKLKTYHYQEHLNKEEDVKESCCLFQFLSVRYLI